MAGRSRCTTRLPFFLSIALAVLVSPNASSEAGCKGSKDFYSCKDGTGYLLRKMLSCCFTRRKKMLYILYFRTLVIPRHVGSISRVPLHSFHSLFAKVVKYNKDIAYPPLEQTNISYILNKNLPLHSTITNLMEMNQ